MRKILGWSCYLVGAICGVWALQMLISCELLAAFSRVENHRYDLWHFLFVSGHHRAYPNGYLVHVLRDLFLFGCSALIIKLGREQFSIKEKTRAEKTDMVSCPGCHRATYPDAYCRFCGYNLITNQPTKEASIPVPFWKISLLAYGSVSVILVLINLLMIEGR